MPLLSDTPVNLLNEYNWAHDIMDIDMLVDCYASDGEATFVLPGGKQVGPVAGQENLRKMYESVAHGMEGAIRRHFITNITVERETADEAVIRTYVMITEAVPTSVSVYGAGWQRDELVKTAEGWRLRKKVLTLDGIGTVPRELLG